MGYLVVRSREEMKRIHLSEISVLILETTSISLTAYLLCELANEKISIIFCDQKRNPHGLYLPLYGSHNTSDRLRKQAQWNEDSKATIWQSIVTQKIYGQSVVLSVFGKDNQARMLRNYISQIEPGDTTNREGHAAKVYFNCLFGNEFSRSDKSDPINGELNYGYSILLSSVSREVVSNGYLTQLGVHHDNMFNEFNLACDLMEPFRPFIDYHVIGLPHQELSKETKLSLVDVLNKRIIFEHKEQYLANALGAYVKSVLDAIEAGNAEMIKYPDYELSLHASDSNV